MERIIAVVDCPSGVAHMHMAAEALKKCARDMGHDIVVEIAGDTAEFTTLNAEQIAAADVVIMAADHQLGRSRFKGKIIHKVGLSEAILSTPQVIASALALIPHVDAKAALMPPAPAASLAGPSTAAPSITTASISASSLAAPQASTAQTFAGKKIVAITACPTGIAHTFMAAEALKKWASANGCDIKVETQGSVGAKNTLSDEEIAAADVVVIGADTHVDLARFDGKRVYKTTVGRALKETKQVMQEALTASIQTASGTSSSGSIAAKPNNADSHKKYSAGGLYKHLLTGVSYMLPLVVAGGLIIALSFVFGIEAFKEKGTLAAALMAIGGGAAFALMIPVLAGFIAYSIADRPGLAPGLIGGMLASQLQTGFLGGILAGFFAGYVARWLADKVQLPVNFEGLKPVLIIPLLASLAVGLFMVYVVGDPAKALMDGMTHFLQTMGTSNAILLGLLLGGMMAVDMGGPINKAAYTFGVGLLASNSYLPMAAVMAAGMVPPLALALATMVASNRFTADERIAGKAAGVLGLSFITEGAIPFAANDPTRVLPACIAGAALTGALSMLFGCALRAPHGGIFVLAIPNAVSPLLPYIVAITAGTALSTLLLVVLKKPKNN